MKTAGLVNKLFTFGAVKMTVKSSSLLAALLVAVPSVKAADVSVAPGTNDGDFSFVVSGTDSTGQLTKHVFKGNIKRFIKGVRFGVNDPKGTATFIYSTNSPVTLTNYWIDVSPGDNVVYYGSLDEGGSVGGYIAGTNNLSDTKVSTGLKYIATAKFPPADGEVEGVPPGSKYLVNGVATNAQVLITCKNPPPLAIRPSLDGLTISCPTNTSFPFDTLYSSSSLGTNANWTALTNQASVVGTNYQWKLPRSHGNVFYKVGTW